MGSAAAVDKGPLVLTFALALAALAQPAAESPRYAEHARLAARALLIAMAAAGERLVAVGDRGVIVFSDDRGASWRQADSVPTQALLSGVCFLDARRGVAVGHDEVAITTADGGRTWQRTHYAPQAQRPLLDVWCGSGGQVIAVGAYSTYLTSADGGASWQTASFRPAPPAAAAAQPAEDDARSDYHLNRIVSAGAARLYIAAEAGHLYRSDDGGRTWMTLASPYAGSFFDVLPLGAQVVLAFGLRGNLYRSEDAGASWRRLDTHTLEMLDGGARLADDAVAIVGLAGVVLVSRDGGRTFTLQQQADRAGLAAALGAGELRLAVASENGARLLALAAPAAAGGSAR